VAIKTIQKSVLTQQEIDDVLTEINILQHLDHPCIVKYMETYSNEKFIYLVMEKLEGDNMEVINNRLR